MISSSEYESCFLYLNGWIDKIIILIEAVAEEGLTPFPQVI
jgi:hypothetical protein